MNFKLNWIKSAGSVVLGYVLMNILFYFENLKFESGMEIGTPPQMYLIVFIFFLILVYVIWSLIQKKK